MNQKMIDRLKANKEVFGEMDKDLQEIIKGMGKDDFQSYAGGRWGVSTALGGFQSDFAYRLRPDYKQESEVVECEIYKDSNSEDDLTFIHPNGNDVPLQNAFSLHDFIGFKYEGGDVCPYPIVYGLKGRLGYATTTSVEDFKKEERFIDHATHVLFRRQT